MAATLPLEVGFKSSQRSSSDVLNISGLPILPHSRDRGRVGTRIRQEWHPADDPQWDQLAACNRRLRWVTIYGVAALTFMVAMSWLEHRGPVFILGFVLGCLLPSIYGFLAGAWPLGVLEGIWV